MKDGVDVGSADLSVSALKLVNKQLAALSAKERAGTAGLALQDRTQSLGVLAELRNGNVQIAQAAAVPTSPSSPKVSRNTILGAVLGLLLGLGVAFLLERPGQADQGAEGPGDDLRPAAARRRPREHRATIARHLAAAAARMGSRVLLLEADLRRPTLAQQLEIQAGPGLSDVLIGAASLPEATQAIDLGHSPVGGSGPRTLDVLVALSGATAATSPSACTRRSRAPAPRCWGSSPMGSRPRDGAPMATPTPTPTPTTTPRPAARHPCRPSPPRATGPPRSRSRWRAPSVEAAASGHPAGNGTVTIKVSQAVTGLQPGVTYHYRVVAASPGGTARGADRTFTTPKIPLSVQIAGVPDPVVFGEPFFLEGTLTGTGASTREIVLQANPFPYLAGFKDVGNPELANSAGGFSFPYVGLLENTQLRVVTVGKPVVASPVVLESVAVRLALQPRRAAAPPGPVPRAGQGRRRRTRVQLQPADPDPVRGRRLEI